MKAASIPHYIITEKMGSAIIPIPIPDNTCLFVPSEFVGLIITKDAYDHLVTALAEADQWTGFPYSQKVFEQSTIIKN